MKNTSEKLFLSEAEKIADHLLTLTCNCSPHTDDIVSGMPGILLFLLELHKHLPDNKYITAVENGICRLLGNGNEHHEWNKYSLYTGRMGLSFLLLRLYHVTADHACLAKALQIAANSADMFLHYEYTSDNLLDGRSGCLLTLIQLYAASGEKWLLNLINQFIGRIVQNARSDGSGLFWGMTDEGRIENGYLDGAAGIGYTFLELGYFFQNTAFYRLAEKALNYAGTYGSHTGEQCQKDAFGIGMARLRAFQLINNQEYNKDLDEICKLLDNNHRHLNALSLNGGKAGYGLSFLDAHKVTGEPDHLTAALNIARDLCFAAPAGNASLAGINAGFFDGWAGIGYFYLQLYDPNPSFFTQSLTSPDKGVNQTGVYPFISIGEAEMKKVILQKDLPRTIYLLEHAVPEQLLSYFGSAPASTGTNVFITFVRSLLPEINVKYDNELRSIFDLECRKLELAADIAANRQLHEKEITRMEQANTVCVCSEEVLLDQWLTIDEDVVLVTTSYPLDLARYIHFEGHLMLTQQNKMILLKATTRCHLTILSRNPYEVFVSREGPTNVLELHLNEIQALLLTVFAKPRKTSDALGNVVAALERQEGGHTGKIVLQYIIDLLKEGILKLHIPGM